ncbi:MAG: hypothetical protein PVS3B2_11630 [Candidatus Dormibacteraceae bacterium]
MSDLGLVFAVVIAGYIVGVWTGALVFRQRQGAYEDSVIAATPTPPIIVLRHLSPRGR